MSHYTTITLIYIQLWCCCITDMYRPMGLADVSYQIDTSDPRSYLGFLAYLAMFMRGTSRFC